MATETAPTAQEPIDSGFGAATTAAEVLEGIDLAGRTAIVTGGYSGIGLEAVRALREAGAEVIVPVRDAAKAATALADIDGVETAPLDLFDPASVKAFAADFLRSGRPLHILIAGAGVMGVPLRRDPRGLESNFVINHLGHFQLTTILWPALVAAEGARVVSVTSVAHRLSDIVWEDTQYDHREYDPMTAYGQSKTADILFAVELDRRGQEEGVRGFVVQPGNIVTPLGRHFPDEIRLKMGVIDASGEPVINPSRNMKTAAQGAATGVWCATSPQLDGRGGVYCENCDIARVFKGDASELSQWNSDGVMPFAVRPISAARLWEVSVGLLGRRAA